MAEVSEALDAMLESVDERHFGYVKTKSAISQKRDRTLLAKRILRFLENVDEDMSVMEVRQALEEEIPD